ncbi:MAG: DUF4340 domain-containing protein [Bdellovibrionia bacterium]
MKTIRMTPAVSRAAVSTLLVSAALCTVMCSVMLSGCSCDRKSGPGAEAQTAAQKTPQGSHPALQFDYKNTSELLIAKSDPASGDRWAARIQRDGIPSPANEDLWTIQMGPDSIAAGDRKAHGTFILHLLDTIRSLQVKEAPVSGSPESFGLASPLFILRWRVSEPRSSTSSAPNPPGTVRAQVFKEYEVRLGSPVKGSDGNFEGLYASFGGLPGKTFIVQGALLRMLDMITSFQTLRLPTVLTISSDDVDEMEIQKPAAKSKFYAQRENGKWADAKHLPVKGDVDAFLEQVTHLRILKFMDDPSELKKMDATLAKSPAYTMTFKDRHGNPTTLKLYALSGGQKAFATFSTRKRQSPNSLAIFEVYPEIFKNLSLL